MSSSTHPLVAVLITLAFLSGCGEGPLVEAPAEPPTLEEGPQGLELAFPGETGLRRTGSFVVDEKTIELEFSEIRGHWVLDGDIVLKRPLEATEDLEQGLATLPRSSLWSRLLIPYVIRADLPSPARVHEAIAHWEARTPLRFVPRTNEPQYVEFVPGTGCSANIGRTGGRGVVTLEPACDRGVVIHEIGHTIGLWHTQSRTDRDDFVRILWSNILEGHEHNFRTYTEQGHAGRDVGAYERASVMHYGSTYFSRNGQPTIVDRASGAAFQPNREALTATDADGVKRIYSELVSSCPPVQRISGSSRYATAAAVSRRAFPSGASSAILVLGDGNSPDALSGASLAAFRTAPLLLTAKDSLPADTRTELTRLGATSVTLVGGAAVISENVASAVRAMGIEVDRLSGTDRFETAASVARVVGSPSKKAFIVNGSAMVDGAVAAGPAANLGAPLLLVQRDLVPAATRAVLQELGITQTIIVGGASAISEAVASQLPSATRLSGVSRYDTAVNVAKWAGSQGMSLSEVWLTRGDDMVDALATFATRKSVLFTERHALTHTTREFLKSHGQTVLIAGGTGAVDAFAEQHACNAVELER